MHEMLGRNIESIEENGLFSFFKSLSFSTLVGPFHADLQNRGTDGIYVAEMYGADNHVFCEKLFFDPRCPSSAALKNKPCAWIMYRSGEDKNILRDNSQPSIYEEYESLVLSRACPQLWK